MKTVDVIEFKLLEADRDVTAAEIAADTGIAESTVRKHLVALIERGVAERSRDISGAGTGTGSRFYVYRAI